MIPSLLQKNAVKYFVKEVLPYGNDYSASHNIDEKYCVHSDDNTDAQ